MNFLSKSLSEDLKLYNEYICRLIMQYLDNRTLAIDNLNIPVIVEGGVMATLTCITFEKDRLIGAFINSNMSFVKDLASVTSPLHQVIEAIENMGYHYEEEIVVCSRCGSTRIETKCWHDANSTVEIDEIDNNETYCRQCEDDMGFTTMGDFKKDMLNFFEDVLTEGQPETSQAILHQLEADSTENFLEKFQSLDYEEQRKLYLQFNPEFTGLAEKFPF